MGTPKTAEGKPIVLMNPCTEGLLTWLTGRGDGPNGRGLGQPMRIDCQDAGSHVVEFGFSEPVEINDGQIWWRPSASWGPDDEFSVGIRMPATVATPTPGTGNVNIVPLGPGMDLYVPALGDGSHTVDLAAAVPVKAAEENGSWAVDDWTGEVTPSQTPGQAGWNLLSFDILAYLVRSISCGHPLGVWDIDVYKTEWIHPSWMVRFEVTKVSAGAGTIGGWLLCFRETVT